MISTNIFVFGTSILLYDCVKNKITRLHTRTHTYAHSFSFYRQCQFVVTFSGFDSICISRNTPHKMDPASKTKLIFENCCTKQRMVCLSIKYWTIFYSFIRGPISCCYFNAIFVAFFPFCQATSIKQHSFVPFLNNWSLEVIWKKSEANFHAN